MRIVTSLPEIIFDMCRLYRTMHNVGYSVQGNDFLGGR